MKRVRGGFRGIIAAIAGEWLDPEDASVGPVEDRFYHLSPAELRARDLRDHRRAKKNTKRPPF